VIVTTGRIIKVNCGSWHFERTSETPGAVVLSLSGDGGSITLPGNKMDAEKLIAAYRRVIEEDVGYRKSEVE
jgi:hypothetical protein